MLRHDGERLIGRSRAIREIEQQIDEAARSDAKVLVTGESGVGKEVVATLIHRRSGRRFGALQTLNCAGLPDSLLESELFGHVRGSFTGAYRDKPGLLEIAHGGTVFMDEVGEMSLRMQAVLLRFLETGEVRRVGGDRLQSRVDVRVIAATNRNLQDRIARHEFREDLYYRLDVVQLHMPPLRERPEDILPLLEYFLGTYSRRQQTPVPELGADAVSRLTSYRWPGNVRELKNFAQRMTLRKPRGGIVTTGDLPPEIHPASPRPVRAPAAPLSTPRALFDEILHTGESFWTLVYTPFMARDLTRAELRAVIRLGLERTRGNYRILVELFNMPATDYKRFLNFLHKYDCQVPFQEFRTIPPSGPPARAPSPEAR